MNLWPRSIVSLQFLWVVLVGAIAFNPAMADGVDDAQSPLLDTGVAILKAPHSSTTGPRALSDDEHEDADDGDDMDGDGDGDDADDGDEMDGDHDDADDHDEMEDDHDDADDGEGDGRDDVENGSDNRNPSAARTDRTPRQQATQRSRPVTLENRRGVTLRGLRIRSDAKESITLIGCRDVRIIGCDVRSIRLENCTRVRVVNSFIHDDEENEGVRIKDSRDVLVQGCRIERVKSGVYAQDSTRVRVRGNYIEDVLGPMPRGQAVQFNRVTGRVNQIMNNVAVNHAGRSEPEDMISIYKSSGTAGSPIRVQGNYLSGDPATGSAGMSRSGSGIMLGDGGGEHIVCRGNVLLSPGQVGIGVAGGGGIAVLDNTVLGLRSDRANVGVYVWHQNDGERGGVVTLRGNRVAWINKDGRENGYWEGGGFERVNERDNMFDDRRLFRERREMPTQGSTPPEPYGTYPAFPWVMGE